MNADSRVLDDERACDHLAACDEALAAGTAMPSRDDHDSASRDETDRRLTCIRLLREVMGGHVDDTARFSPSGDSVCEPDRELPFQKVGRYLMRRELGRGSYGIVFQAHDPELRRDVAIKVPRGEAILSRSLRERFLREARAAALLNHPNVITVHEAGEVGPLCYIAAELCPGITLAAWLKTRPGRVPVRDAAALLVTLARAVAHAHDRGILHRDLKPANIMLDASGRRESGDLSDQPLRALVPKITDFGLAKFFEEQDDAETQSGALIGTPQYMAPEQARGKGKAAGPAADIYGLGATLYELLTGRPPFQGETSIDTIHQVLEDELLPPRRFRSQVPRDLEIICLKCLEKDPKRRYASAAALAEDLDRYLADRPILARPSSRLELAVRWCRKNPALAASSGLALAALLGVTIVATLYSLSSSLNAQRLGQYAEQLQKTLNESEEHRQQSELRLAEAYLENGRALCERGNGTAALLLLARALQVAPEREQGLQHAIRTHIGSFADKLHRPSLLLDAGGQVTAVTRSADGTMIAAGRIDGTILLWLTKTGSRILEIRDHQARIRSLAFTSGGDSLLSGSEDGTVRIRRGLSSGAPSVTVLEHGSPVKMVSISPDGVRALSAGTDGSVKLWFLSTGKPTGIAVTHSGGLAGAHFDHTGKAFVTFGGSNSACVWDVGTGELRPSPLRQQHWIHSAAFSACGRFVLTGSGDCTARLWERSTGKPIGSPFQHHGGVVSTVFNATGDRFVTASGDGAARVWDTATRQPIGRIMRHELGISAALNADGSILATGSDDQTVRLWDVASGEPVGLPLRHAGQIWGMSFMPDGRLLTWGLDDPIRLWSLAEHRAASRTLFHQHSVTAVACSPNGKMVVTGAYDALNQRGIVQRWSPATCQPIGSPETRAGRITSVAFSPDSSRFGVTVGGHDLGELCVYETATGKPIGQPVLHPRTVAALAFTPQETNLLTASHDRKVHFIDLAKGTVIKEFAHEDYVTSVAMSPDGTKFVTGSEDRLARFWDVAAGTIAGQPLRHQGAVNSVAFSPDGTLVLTSSVDQTAQLWDARTRQRIGKPLRHNEWVASAIFSPDGTTVLTASADGTLQFWDVATQWPLGLPLQHKSLVFAAAFRPDGKEVVSASNDTTARFWPVPAAVDGEIERVVLWAQVVTGAELGNGDVVHVLDAHTWQERREQLERMGGPPATTARRPSDASE